MHRRTLAVLIVLAALFGAVMPVAAAARLNLVFRVDCDGFVSRGGFIVFDRDNTGNNREQVMISATDGNGNVIYNETTESLVVGGRIELPPGLSFDWTAAPQANPLTVTVTSPAGNGLEEETIYIVAANCDDLPDTETIVINLDNIYRFLDGRTSPSVPLNGVPPRVLNPFSPLDYNEIGYVVVESTTVNLRSGPGGEYTIVGRADAGTELIVLGQNRDASWWYVQVGEVVGWVNAELVYIRGDLTGTPIIEPMGEILPVTFVPYRSQPIYALPLPRALGVCEIPGNLEYRIVGRNSSTTWFEIEAVCGDDIVTGWIEAENGAVRNAAEANVPVTD